MNHPITVYIVINNEPTLTRTEAVELVTTDYDEAIRTRDLCDDGKILERLVDLPPVT